jgi:hypothetical protein
LDINEGENWEYLTGPLCMIKHNLMAKISNYHPSVKIKKN